MSPKMLKCRFCGNQYNRKTLKIHGRNCKRKKKQLKPMVQGVEFEKDFAENLQQATDKDQDQLQQELATVLNRAINEDPEKFKKAIKEKGYEM